MLNTANLGKFNATDSQVVQKENITGGEDIRGGPVYWQRSAANGGPLLYNWGASDVLKAYPFNGTTFAASPSARGSGSQTWPGGILTLSANGEQQGSGVLWATVVTGGDAENNPPVPGELHAFDAANVSHELWNSTMNASRDRFGNFAKFVPPLVANGKVYVATWSNQLAVYGLLTTYNVSPLSLTFGSETANVASAPLLATVTNTGTVALPITGIALSGTDASQFSQTTTCGTSLAVGSNCTISVVFTPTSAGSKTAMLNVKGGGAGAQSVALSGVGVVLSYTLSPTALAFGSETTNLASAPLLATVTNTGTVALPITGIALSGTDAGQFSQTNTCGTSLAVGSSCTISVVFTPTSVGSKAAMLNVNGGGAGAQSVALSGVGVVLSYTLSPTALSFGSETTNVASAPLLVTVTNTGTVALPITGIVLSGTDASQFSQTTTCGTSLAVGSNCTISVMFKPTSPGSKAATLNVNGGGAGTQSVALSGVGVVLSYTLSPTALAFGSETTNLASAPLLVTVTNTGTVALPITGIALSGTDASQFSQTTTCGTSLAVGSNCTISVVFKPTSAGSKAAALNVNVGGAPTLVPLSGLVPLNVSVKASAATVTAGTSVTVTWVATTGASCSATGGSATDGWTGSIATSGTKAITESTAGTYSYGLNCSAGFQTQKANASVVVTWPVVSAAVTASPTTLSPGSATTVTWTSTNATSCAASGGGANDGWDSPSRLTSGSALITEPGTESAGQSETLLFTITCTSSTSKLSASSSVSVVQLGPTSSGGGGGALDLLSLAWLLSILALLRLRRRGGDLHELKTISPADSPNGRGDRNADCVHGCH